MTGQSEEKKVQYRKIYELLHESPQVNPKEISEKLGITYNAARARLREAISNGYIVGPLIMKKSFANLKEYICIVKCELTYSTYYGPMENPDIFFHAKTMGYSDLITVSKEKPEIEGDIICEGYRSDYYIPYTPPHSWKDAVHSIRDKVETFNSDAYEPKNYIKTHFGETAAWDLRDELIFNYLKYNIREPYQPLTSEPGITRETIMTFFERLPHVCDITTCYFPDTQNRHSSYFFVLDTDYEDFVIESLSELPTCSLFFKIADSFFYYVRPPPQYSRGLGKDDLMYHIHYVIDKFKQRGIITESTYSVVECIYR
jgi:hypothetical protein